MATLAGNKREAESANKLDNNSGKRPRLSEANRINKPADLGPKPSPPGQRGGDVKGKKKATAEENETQVVKEKPKERIRKLAPPRPFPTVPSSVSATGPRSAHLEGKNYICVTRRTPLGGYLRRCKDVVLKDGHKTLHLNALGAAIPHLLQLALSLPSILPYPPGDIHTEILTGTVEVQDEVIPEDEEEDISYRTRGKSSLSVVIRIGDGVDEGPRTGKGRPRPGGAGTSRNSREKKQKQKQKQGTQEVESKNEDESEGEEESPEHVVFREEDMDDM